jgi:hypothetical protein
MPPQSTNIETRINTLNAILTKEAEQHPMATGQLPLRV